MFIPDTILDSKAFKQTMQKIEPENEFQELAKALHEYRWNNRVKPDVIYIHYPAYQKLLANRTYWERRVPTETGDETFEGVPVIYANVPTEGDTWFRFFSEFEIEQALNYFDGNPNQSVFYYHDSFSHAQNVAMNGHLPYPSGFTEPKKIHRDVVRAYIQYLHRKETQCIFGQFNKYEEPSRILTKSRLDYKFGFEINPGY